MTPARIQAHAYLIMDTLPCPDEVRRQARCRHCGGPLGVIGHGVGGDGKPRSFTARCRKCKREAASMWHYTEWMALTDPSLAS